MNLFSPWPLAILAHSVSWSFLQKDKKAQRIEQRVGKKLLIFAKQEMSALWSEKHFHQVISTGSIWCQQMKAAGRKEISQICKNRYVSFMIRLLQSGQINRIHLMQTNVSLREPKWAGKQFVLFYFHFLFSPVDILKLVDLAGPETFNTTSEPKWNPSKRGNIAKYMRGNNTPFDHLTAHNKTILFCFCYLSQNCTKCSLPDKIANSKRKSCDVMVFHYSREESSSWVLEILQYKFSLVGRLCIQNLYWGLTKELKAFLHFSNPLL